MELRIFLIILLLGFYCTLVHGHKSKLLSFEKCKHPDPPMHKNLNKIMHITIETYVNKMGKLIVRGNTTILQDFTIYGVFRSGVEKNKQFRYNLEYKKMTCNNLMVKLILNAVRIKYDPKDCRVLKGQYVFNDLDVSAIDKAVNFIPAREAGINIWYFGTYGKEGSYTCFDIRIKIE